MVEISGQDGSSREILALDRKRESDFHEVSELPGGRGLLFTTHTAQGADTIALFAGGNRRDVLKLPGETLRNPVYADGYLLYGQDTTRPGVWAVRFSLASLETQGTPILIDAAGNSPSVASDGTLAMVPRSDLPSEFVWIDRAGSVSSQGPLAGHVPNVGPWTTMRLSPDGQKVAVGVSGAAGEDVWLYDLKRGMEGHFSPDGRWLAYLSDESGPFEVYLRRFPIGPDRVQISNGGAGPVSWSSDGRELIYRGSGGLMSAKLNERDGTLEPTAHRLIQLT
jgi:hypothetical protein